MEIETTIKTAHFVSDGEIEHTEGFRMESHTDTRSPIERKVVKKEFEAHLRIAIQMLLEKYSTRNQDAFSDAELRFAMSEVLHETDNWLFNNK